MELTIDPYSIDLTPCNLHFTSVDAIATHVFHEAFVNPIDGWLHYFVTKFQLI